MLPEGIQMLLDSSGALHEAPYGSGGLGGVADWEGGQQSVDLASE